MKGLFVPLSIRKEKMPPACKMFYADLCVMADHDDKVHYGNEYLAKKQNVTKSTIHNWLTILEKKGYINRVWLDTGRGVERKREIWIL